jgi:hypothetical protein
MKKLYTTPQIQVHGDVHRITAMFGAQQVQDVLVNPSGQVVQTGTGSIDACPTQSHPPTSGSNCYIVQ